MKYDVTIRNNCGSDVWVSYNNSPVKFIRNNSSVIFNYEGHAYEDIRLLIKDDSSRTLMDTTVMSDCNFPHYVYSNNSELIVCNKGICEKWVCKFCRHFVLREPFQKCRTCGYENENDLYVKNSLVRNEDGSVLKNVNGFEFKVDSRGDLIY